MLQRLLPSKSEPVAVALQRALSSVPMPRELAEAERALALARAELAKIRDDANAKRRKYLEKYEGRLEAGVREADAKLAEAEGRVKVARRRRGELQPAHLAAVSRAVAPIIAPTAESIVAHIAALRSAFAVLAEIAAVAAPNAFAASDPATGRAIPLDWPTVRSFEHSSLVTIEGFAAALLATGEGQ